MSEPPNQSDPEQPATSRREVADWEYRTAYQQDFQLRFSPALYDRLREWAGQERKSLSVLIIEILEEAAGGRRGRQE